MSKAKLSHDGLINTNVHPRNTSLLTNELFANFNNPNKTSRYKSQEIVSGL